jgi:hypothetical protein
MRVTPVVRESDACSHILEQTDVEHTSDITVFGFKSKQLVWVEFINEELLMRSQIG